MNKVVRILVERDGLTVDEALEQVRMCADDINEALLTGYYEPEDILRDQLSLEPDYIFDVLNV